MSDFNVYKETCCVTTSESGGVGVGVVNHSNSIVPDFGNPIILNSPVTFFGPAERFVPISRTIGIADLKSTNSVFEFNMYGFMVYKGQVDGSGFGAINIGMMIGENYSLSSNILGKLYVNNILDNTPLNWNYTLRTTNISSTNSSIKFNYVVHFNIGDNTVTLNRTGTGTVTIDTTNVGQNVVISPYCNSDPELSLAYTIEIIKLGHTYIRIY